MVHVWCLAPAADSRGPGPLRLRAPRLVVQDTAQPAAIAPAAALAAALAPAPLVRLCTPALISWRRLILPHCSACHLAMHIAAFVVCPPEGLRAAEDNAMQAMHMTQPTRLPGLSCES